jgi:hypothetical protein
MKRAILAVTILLTGSEGCDDWNSCKDSVFVLSGGAAFSCSRSDHQLVVLENVAHCYCPARGANAVAPQLSSE